jgi:hypothetical protein
VRAVAVRMARALLPSWRFFDQIAPAPKLFCRTAQANASLGPWLPLAFRPAPSWAALAYNPAGNLALARHALLEQLLGDVAEPEVQDASAVLGLTSYALVAQLVREQVRQLALAAGPEASAAGARFQFKITLVDAATGRCSLAEDVLVSQIHEV